MNYILSCWPITRARKFLEEKAGASLSDSPNYREQEDLSVDEIRELTAWCDLAGEHYVLVPHAEDMAEEAANALLKTLEENERSMFVFNTTRPLISTICSRCITLPFHVDRDSVISYINATYPHYLRMDPGAADRAWDFTHDTDVVDDLFGGKGPMHILKELDKDLLAYLKEPKAMLKLLGMLEEKNSENYFEKFHEYISNLCGFLLSKLFPMFLLSDDKEGAYLSRKLDIVIKNSFAMNSRTYSKADFFAFICELCA